MEDSNFIKDIGTSVTKRSVMVSEESERFKESEKELDADEQLQHYKDLVKSESDMLYKYEEADFTDQKLKKLASDYIEGLKAQEKALEYVHGNLEKYDELWSEGYDKRSVALLEIVNEYGADVDDNTLETLK